MRWLLVGFGAMAVGALLALIEPALQPRVFRTAAPRFGEGRKSAREEGNSGARGPERTESGQEAEAAEQAVVEEERLRVEDADPAELARAGTWRKALEHYAPWSEYDDERPATQRHLEQALSLAENPVARQNIIFLTAGSLPLGMARKVLAPLLEAGTAGDIEDVICALASVGDAALRERFEELARVPSSAAVAQLHDTLFEIELVAKLANEPARDILRSYRMYELLAREHYFRLADEGLDDRWTLGGPDVPAIRLWARWLARYPGHPGSDDVAILIGNEYIGNGQPDAALRWYDRAACLPDQKRTSKALRLFVEVAERELGLEELERFLRAEDVRNPGLLRYVIVRRIAAERGMAAGLERVRRFAEADPACAIAEAWRRRGTAPSVVDDAKRLGAVHDRVAGDRSDYDRLHPPREAMPLSIPAMARQFGLWERALESAPLARAKLMAEEVGMFHPVYARRTFETGYLLDLVNERIPDRWTTWVKQNVAPARSYVLFAELERSHPDRAGEAAYGKALALAQLLDYAPLDRRPKRHGLRGVRKQDVACFLRHCARVREDFPDSEWGARADALAIEYGARYADFVRE